MKKIMISYIKKTFIHVLSYIFTILTFGLLFAAYQGIEFSLDGKNIKYTL